MFLNRCVAVMFRYCILFCREEDDEEDFLFIYFLRVAFVLYFIFNSEDSSDEDLHDVRSDVFEGVHRTQIYKQTQITSEGEGKKEESSSLGGEKWSGRSVEGYAQQQ